MSTSQIHFKSSVYVSFRCIMWARVGLMGSVALGSMFWSQKKNTETSPYELKLIQVLFRHGARTPLKSIPDVLEVRELTSANSMPKVTPYSVFFCLCGLKTVRLKRLG